MKIKKLVVILLAVFATCGSTTAMEEPAQFVQRHFSAEDTGVKRPIPVPEDVLDILRKDEGVRAVLEGQKILEEALPPSWFAASAIHLSTRTASDYVLQGEGPISGANVTTFWIFRSTARGHQLILTATAHDLVVGHKRRNGYLEIETMSATASEVTTVWYKFGSRRYIPYRERTELL